VRPLTSLSLNAGRKKVSFDMAQTSVIEICGYTSKYVHKRWRFFLVFFKGHFRNWKCYWTSNGWRAVCDEKERM